MCATLFLLRIYPTNKPNNKNILPNQGKMGLGVLMQMADYGTKGNIMGGIIIVYPLGGVLKP